MTAGGTGPDDGPRPWFVDERRTLGRENADPVHVAHYDLKEDADAGAEVAWLRRLLPDRTASVVDLGAGTGQFALRAAQHWRQVVAVDPSPVMCAELARKVAEAASPLTIVEAGFLTFTWPPASVDLVYTRYALHHLPDFFKDLALTRMRALLRPGGLLRLWDLVYDFEPADAVRRLDHWCQVGAPVEADTEHGWTRADIVEHVRDEHSTFTWLLEPMITRAGFAFEDRSYGEDGVSARYLLRAVDPSPSGDGST